MPLGDMAVNVFILRGKVVWCRCDGTVG